MHNILQRKRDVGTFLLIAVGAAAANFVINSFVFWGNMNETSLFNYKII